MVSYFKGELLFSTLYIMFAVEYYSKFIIETLIYFISIIIMSV